MKYFIQIATTIATTTLPFFVFLLAHSSGGTLQLTTVDIVFKKINIVVYGIVCIISIFGYANLVNREIKSDDNKVCYTLAQYIFLLTAVTAFAYGYVTSEWISVVRGMPGTEADVPVVDIFKSIVDFMAAIDLCLVTQYIAATHFKRWLMLPKFLQGDTK